MEILQIILIHQLKKHHILRKILKIVDIFIKITYNTIEGDVYYVNKI